MANQYTKQEFDLKEAIRLYESGMSQTEVAAAIGTTQRVVHARFKKAGYSCRVAAKRNQMGEANPMWKGDKATRSAMHVRLYKRFGQPSKCEECGAEGEGRSYDWANLTGHYADPNDYKRLCRSCHWKLDDKKQNWKGAVGGRPSPSKEVTNHASK